MSTGYRSRLPQVEEGSGQRRIAGRKLVLALGVFTVLGSAFCIPVAQAQGKEVVVAAAADMQPVFEAVGPAFEKQTGIHLKLSYASSSELSQQMQHGAPFDIFFSADYFFAEQVVAASLTETKSPQPYARGVLVLWAPKGFPVHPLSVDVLSRKDIGKVAIANPERAPYGRAAVAALKHMNFWTSLQPKIVQAESVGQAAQFALTGNAQVAVISQTLAVSPKFREAGTFAPFPVSQYPAIRQCVVLHKDSPHAQEAHALLRYMLGPAVQSRLPQLGLRAAAGE